MNTASSRKQLRQAMRQRRRALSAQQQRLAAQQLCRQISTNGLLLSARHIALYLANDGEIDPAELCKRLRRQRKRCYLPVLQPDGSLNFKLYYRGQRMRANRFGILEPVGKSQRPSKALDLVLLPLVAFDKNGGRLGMGGGFYDRTFAWINQQPKLRRPKLIGLAHHFQEVEQLNTASWDIPLHGIATDRAVTLFS